MITDEAKIDAVLDRSVDTIYPDREELKKRMMDGEQLRIYAGIDATADRVHLAHVINYLMLERFRKLGHKVIVLIGDFTARIGDPSDKDEARNQLSAAEVQKNMKAFRSQIAKVMDISNEDNPVEIRTNSDWLSKMNFSDVIDLASNFTVQRMLERDVFERRLDDEKPLYVHEFFYPLMQGFDTVALEADVEIGGTDQTFNMLAGRKLRKRIEKKDKFVITHPLLEDPNTGEMLMSKSKGKGVFLDEKPADMFAQVMKLPDGVILDMFTHCTDLPLKEIANYKTELEKGTNPRDIKLKLSHAIVTLIYDNQKASEAQESFVSTFSNQETPGDVEGIIADSGDRLMDILAEHEVVPSKSQFRRLVDQGAISNTETEEKITDHTFEVTETTTFKVGKHRFVRVSTK